MRFLDRRPELGRLDALATRGNGLAVVWGRRRIGKSRLLVEWARKHGGLYIVADQSAPGMQRRYLAQSVATRLSGFDAVEYPDWATLLTRLAREAAAARFAGPLILDELPYLVAGSPELPSVLQRWVDHETAALTVALAGSSQRMMQGLVLDRNAPLFGRARELIELGPLPPRFIREAFGGLTAAGAVEHFAAWGGVPRYWELATEVKGGILDRLEALALDPLGPLHRDPDLLLLEEIPSALEVRPVLDAIGGGAHRVSEIAGRLGRPATSLSRPLDRLVDMKLVGREIPFGEPARSSKRSLYRIDDPFFRFWFRVVAPNRSRLTASGRADRRRLLAQAWPALAAAAWEDLCRRAVPLLESGPLGRAGPWSPAQRWWQGNQPEWDVVASSVEGDKLLLGEVKWRDAALSAQQTGALAQTLAARQAPPLANDSRWRQVLRVLFVPLIRGKPSLPPGVAVCTADAVLAA